MLRDMPSTTDKLMKEDFTHKLCETKQKSLDNVRGIQMIAPTSKFLENDL